MPEDEIIMAALSLDEELEKILQGPVEPLEDIEATPVAEGC